MQAKKEKASLNQGPCETQLPGRERRTVSELSLGGLLNETFAVYGANLGPILLISAIVQVPASLFTLAPIPALVEIFALGAVSIVATALVHGSITWAVAHHYVNGVVDVRACFRRAWWRILSLVTLFLIAGAAVLGWYLIASALGGPALTGTSSTTDASDSVSAVTSILAIGYFLLLIYLMVYFGFAPQAAIIEGCRPLEALKRSMLLVRKRWWMVFVRLLALSLIVLGMFIALMLPAVLLASAEEPVAIADTLSFLSDMVVAVLVSPLVAIGGALIYFDLRARKEGYDSETLSGEVSMAGAAKRETDVAVGPETNLFETTGRGGL